MEKRIEIDGRGGGGGGRTAEQGMKNSEKSEEEWGRIEKGEGCTKHLE